jgi:hypothetical protein
VFNKDSSILVCKVQNNVLVFRNPTIIKAGLWTSLEEDYTAVCHWPRHRKIKNIYCYL